MPHRLFVALRPPAHVREALLDIMEGVDGARWQDEEHLHLTIRFIGEVERPVANDLGAALADIGWGRFPLSISGVGAFERGGRRGRGPHAIWARVSPTPELEGLRQKVERAAELAGLPRETRRFTPHVTLARLGARAGPIANWLSTFGDVRAGPWDVDAFILYESHLGHTGAHYEAVETYGLKYAATRSELETSRGPCLGQVALDRAGGAMMEVCHHRSFATSRAAPS